MEIEMFNFLFINNNYNAKFYLPQVSHIQKVLYFLPDAFFSKFCGPLPSLASLPFYLWPARFARKYLTLDQFTSRDVGRIFLWGGLSASEASRRVQSICAASKASKLWQGSGGAAPSGVQGRSPLAGARGAQPPWKFFAK